MRGLLDEIGYVDVLIARELPDGRLGLIDGHLRRDTTPDQEVPVIVVDVTEKEADKILATLDPLAAMAEMDSERITSLLATVQTNSEAVKELLKRTVGDRIGRSFIPPTSPSLKFRLTAPKHCARSGRSRPASFGKPDRTGLCVAIAETGIWSRVSGPPLRGRCE